MSNPFEIIYRLTCQQAELATLRENKSEISIRQLERKCERYHAEVEENMELAGKLRAENAQLREAFPKAVERQEQLMIIADDLRSELDAAKAEAEKWKAALADAERGRDEAIYAANSNRS